MIDRRDFLRKAGIIAGGIIAADQLEILERLTWKRTLFPSAQVSEPSPLFHLPDSELEKILRSQLAEVINAAMDAASLKGYGTFNRLDLGYQATEWPFLDYRLQ